MTRVLSTFHTDQFDFLEVLEELTRFFEVVQQNLSSVDSEQCLQFTGHMFTG
jgi:hypothetical protein